MKYPNYLYIILLGLFFAQAGYGQIDTNLIVEVTCPEMYPIPGDSLMITVKITNVGVQTSLKDTLYFGRVAFNLPDYGHRNFYGSFEVMALAPNASITLSKQFLLPTGLPGLYSPNGEYGGGGHRVDDRFILVFDNTVYPWYSDVHPSAYLDFYCRQYDTDLSMTMSAIDTVYGFDGKISYSVSVKNEGAITAYNVEANIHEGLNHKYIGYNNYPFLLNQFIVDSEDSIVVSMEPVGYAIQWQIDSLEAGESMTRQIDFKIRYVYPTITLPGKHLVKVSVSSGHNTNTDFENDIDSLLFKLENECLIIESYQKMGEYQGHGYYLSDTTTSWIAAKTLAENAEGYLATIADLDENSFIKNGLGDQEGFIGYSDYQTEGIGQWVNNEQVVFDLSYDNSLDNDFAIMSFGDESWQMLPGFIEKKHVLEKVCGNTCPDTYDFSTEIKIDSFGILYPDCHEYLGSIKIQYTLSTSLLGLSGLTKIFGNLVITDANSLVNLNGLNNLELIQNGLSIRNNTNLLNLTGLQNFEKTDGGITIHNNPMLTNIDGLANLSSIGGLLKITENDMLTNIDALANISSIGENLRINNNPMLTNIDGFANLSSIGGYLSINNNPKLTNLDGLANLSSIDGNFYIYNNAMLTDCCGIQPILSTPEAIGGSINISNNPSSCSNVAEILYNCVFSMSIQNVASCIYANDGSLQIAVHGYDTIPFFYTWERDEDGATGSGSSPDDIFSIENLSPGTYNITVTTTTPDTIINTGIVLEETPLPVANFTFSIEGLTLSVSNTSLDATNYLWQFGDGASNITSNPIHTFYADGSYNILLIASNNCGSDTMSLTLIVAGQNELDAGIDFELYPNPNNGQFTFEFNTHFSNQIDLQIVDILGRTVWQKNWPSCQNLKTNINLNSSQDFPKGSYFYTLRSGNHLVNGKIFVE